MKFISLNSQGNSLPLHAYLHEGRVRYTLTYSETLPKRILTHRLTGIGENFKRLLVGSVHEHNLSGARMLAAGDLLSWEREELG